MSWRTCGPRVRSGPVPVLVAGVHAAADGRTSSPRPKAAGPAATPKADVPHTPGFGNVSRFPDLVQVVVQVKPGGDTETPVGDAADDFQRLGRVLAVGYGAGVVVMDFF